MARVGGIITVEYISNAIGDNAGLWYVMDNWNDVVGEHRTKEQAVTAAKRFSKDRATSTGVNVKLEIHKKDGSVSKTHQYEPEY